MDDCDCDEANVSGWGTPPRDFRPSWWAMAPGLVVLALAAVVLMRWLVTGR